jgi:hypothetical protein
MRRYVAARASMMLEAREVHFRSLTDRGEWRFCCNER